MKKLLQLTFLFVLILTSGYSQTNKYWASHNDSASKLVADKGVARQSFPKEFKLFDLNTELIRETLFSTRAASKAKTIISLPNADGNIEEFEIFEASNFDDELQARFPEIRAYSGQGITDKYATLKLSIAPNGIQTMVFRTDKENEFIEPYSQDHTVYAVFKSQRDKGKLAWACATDDQKMVADVTSQVPNTNKSSLGELKTMRLAQSCNGEYAAYFGASTAGNATDQGKVLAAFNATLTRCNGVYEKDLALHLNLVSQTTNIIYYNPATDPYSTTLSSWNTSLQKAINTTLSGTGTPLATNNGLYDIGHMFGASGGGGNAGCIGCVCVNGTTAGSGSTKGRGITSPADGIPQGDNFDIDYVVHEIGHQLGGNHTFSNSNEGSGVSKEVGSGITIMGYAGITTEDIADHSIDAYHEATIAQIQANLATKTCPVTTNITANNATPVVAVVSNYTIPKSTPFVLTGSATDANVGDALTYSWEQNDDGGSSTGTSSSASATKTVGPNFISFAPTASPSRYFPKISSIIANSATTGFITPSCINCDAGMLSEALSSVARTLNFRLTVRDNSPYSSIAPLKIGQTAFTDMAVTVNATAGPFLVNSPNTAITWVNSTNQNVTWDVAGTDGNGVNTAFVDIFLSTDGGLTYPLQLANKVPNDGSEVVTVSNTPGSTNRIMVKGNNQIFFDISNNNFNIDAPSSTFAVAASGVQTTLACTLTSTTFTFDYKAIAGFSGTTTFSAAGNPAGSTVSFSPSSMTSDGPVTMTVGNLTGLGGNSNILVTASSGATSKVVPFYLYLGLSNVALAAPVDNATTQNTSLALTWATIAAATSYDVQVASDAGFTTIVSSGNVSTNSYNATGLLQGTDYFWRVLPKNATCIGTYGIAFKFTTGVISCPTAVSSTNVPLAISASGTPTVDSILNIPAGGTISDVNITMNATHSYVSDLTVTLISPLGTQVQLFSGQCTSNADINATFDDAGTALTCSGTAPTLTGVRIPAQALSTFNGESSTGTWTLRIADGFDVDGGSLASWSLNICTIQPLSVKQNTFDDFALYPNPNNGDFTVKFNSTSNSNDIKVNVHDMRGRQVYEKSFINTGSFNQNINLNKVQAGVYLVSIIDGDNKTVKRIIVK